MVVAITRDSMSVRWTQLASAAPAVASAQHGYRVDTPVRRADARKNIAAILDAATTSLARDPDASINDIAQAAGVGRVTLYGHFESRAVLVAAVVERAMGSTDRDLASVDVTGEP